MRLIILNGPTGVGKSTTAKLVHQKIPLSFLLDPDTQRHFVSHYREYKDESRAIGHAVGRSILQACLELDCDVIIDKTLLKAEVIDAYRAIADKFGATISEYILWAPKNVVMERAHARGWREGGLLTPEKCEWFWDEMNAFKDTRTNAIVIDVTGKEPTDILAEILGTQSDQ